MPESKPSIPVLPPVVRIPLPEAEILAEAVAVLLTAWPQALAPEKRALVGATFNRFEARIAEAHSRGEVPQ